MQTVVGRIEPRLITPTTGGMATWGTEVARWAVEHLGVELMAWQRVALDRLLATAGGQLVHRRGLISVARQNGKTMILKALVGWWLTEGPVRRGQPQSVLHTAHKLDLLRNVFEELAPVLVARFGGRAQYSFGRQEVTLPDGTRYRIAAAKPSSGHGWSVDLAVLDELWDISADTVEVGIGPSQRARSNPLMVGFSTAGDQSSTLMLQWREAAVRAIDADRAGSMFMAEWSPPPGADPDDPATWAYANPAMGSLISLDTLAGEAAGDDRSAFLRSSLNMWVSAANGWLPHGAWAACGLVPATPAEGGWLACDSSSDGQRWVGVRCDPAGTVAVAFVASSEPEAWVRITTVMEDPTVSLAYSPPLEVHLPERWAKRSRRVGYQEIREWTGLVRNAILDRRVHHAGELGLGEHVERAVGVYSNNALSLSSTKSPGPIELCRCLVWAYALATTPKRRARPAIAFG
jgi:hypothetical protein